jgi:hypothetical protein
MKIIKNYCEKFKKTKIYIWYKSLPVSVVGLTTFLAILVFLTAIFNWFWTGTGIDPTRTFYAPFTNEFKEFQDYATLYIALLAFGATMFAGLAVFLVFNDWKEQHNTSIETEYKKEILKIARKIRPIENKYQRMFTDYHLYKGNPEFSLPIKIDMDDASALVDNANELLGLLNELYLASNDIKYKDFREKYFKHANLYPKILANINYIMMNDDPLYTNKNEDILKILGTNFHYEHKSDSGIISDHWSKYATCFNAIDNLEIIIYIVNQLKVK